MTDVTRKIKYTQLGVYLHTLGLCLRNIEHNIYSHVV